MNIVKMLEALRNMMKHEKPYVPPGYIIPLTGIYDIDRDHIELTRLIHHVENINENSFHQFSAHVLDYLTRHIRAEEKLMASCNYPGLKMHKLEHRTLRALVAVFIGPHGESHKDRQDAIRECKEVFTHHINAHDMPMAEFIKGHVNVTG